MASRTIRGFMPIERKRNYSEYETVRTVSGTMRPWSSKELNDVGCDATIVACGAAVIIVGCVVGAVCAIPVIVGLGAILAFAGLGILGFGVICFLGHLCAH